MEPCNRCNLNTLSDIAMILGRIVRGWERVSRTRTITAGFALCLVSLLTVLVIETL